jgi:hypothetical protein
MNSFSTCSGIINKWFWDGGNHRSLPEETANYGHLFGVLPLNPSSDLLTERSENADGKADTKKNLCGYPT